VELLVVVTLAVGLELAQESPLLVVWLVGVGQSVGSLVILFFLIALQLYHIQGSLHLWASMSKEEILIAVPT
jgi:hypothetical protein